MYFTCLDGGLGGSDFNQPNQPNSPGGSAREGPYACGGEESGEALGAAIYRVLRAWGLWELHSGLVVLGSGLVVAKGGLVVAW